VSGWLIKKQSRLVKAVRKAREKGFWQDEIKWHLLQLISELRFKIVSISRIDSTQ
jgi:hypothetical protein